MPYKEEGEVREEGGHGECRRHFEKRLVPLSGTRDTDTLAFSLYTLHSQTINRHPLFHMNRIAQLNAARKSMLYPTGDDVIKGTSNRSSRLPKDILDFDLGTILLGQDHHQAHPINPSLDPGGSIFAEMMLNAL